MKVVEKLEEVPVQGDIPLIQVMDRDTGYMVALGIMRAGQEPVDFADAVGAIVMTISTRFQVSPEHVLELVQQYVDQAEIMELSRMN